MQCDYEGCWIDWCEGLLQCLEFWYLVDGGLKLSFYGGMNLSFYGDIKCCFMAVSKWCFD